MAVTKIGSCCFRSLQRPLCSIFRITLLPQRCLSNETAPPKKPLSAYMMFIADKREQVKLANPDVNKQTELVKIMAEMWRHLDDNEKEMYQENSSKARGEYKSILDNYMNSLTDEQKTALKKQQEHVKKQRTKRRLKKIAKENDKPKKPMSAFLLYVKEHSLERGDAPLPQYVSGMAQHWNKMPVDDKQQYYDEYKKAWTKYENDLHDWEEKMINEGKTNLVRAFLKPQVKKRKPKKKSASKKKATKGKSTKKSSNKSKKETTVDPDPSWMREE